MDHSKDSFELHPREDTLPLRHYVAIPLWTLVQDKIAKALFSWTSSETE